MTLADVLDLGFDLSESEQIGVAIVVTVRCSQCEALCINGTPTHEAGCPNTLHECTECGAYIPHRQKRCEECHREWFNVEYGSAFDSE